MRSQVYRRDIDGPDMVRLSGRGEVVRVEYDGRLVDEVHLADVRRGVAISLGGGSELSLMGGDGANRIVVKLDGDRLKPVVMRFDWAAYAPLVVLVTAVVSLFLAGLAYAGVEWAWHLVIRREALVIGMLLLVLYWSGTRFSNLVGAIVMVVDVFFVLSVGFWNPVTLLFRLVAAGYLVRVAYGEWRSVSGLASAA